MSDIDTAIAELGELGVTPPPAKRPRSRVRMRPMIMVREHEALRVVNEAEQALARMGGIFVRGQALVEVVRDRGGIDWLARPQGSPVIARVAPERVRELLGVAATWWAPAKDDKPRQIAVPTWVVDTLLARSEWSLLVLEGITDAPVFRPDGSILAVPGYDPATRMIFDPCGVEFPPVPDAPTQNDARLAIVELMTPFGDFPFVAESDLSAAASLILSVIARASIEGPVPMHSVGAPTPGSGKGLLVDACAVIATGRETAKMAPTRDDEETRKRLLAIALESPAMVCLDNVEGSIGSPTLAMALTTGSISDRVLGSTKVVTASLRSIWALTGNNVQLRGDLGRRVVPIGLDPKVEHPEDRAGFEHTDLLAYLRRERPRLVVAGLTILRAHAFAERPDHGLPSKGSFASWDRVVRAALIWAGGADPLGGVARIREAGDSDLDNLRALLSTWILVIGDRAVTASDLIDRAIMSTQLREALQLQVEGPLTAKALGYALRKVDGRPCDRQVLRAVGRGNAGAQWRVMAAE